jgi:hypothetical protein
LKSVEDQPTQGEKDTPPNYSSLTSPSPSQGPTPSSRSQAGAWERENADDHCCYTQLSPTVGEKVCKLPSLDGRGWGRVNCRLLSQRCLQRYPNAAMLLKPAAARQAPYTNTIATGMPFLHRRDRQVSNWGACCIACPTLESIDFSPSPHQPSPRLQLTKQGRGGLYSGPGSKPQDELSSHSRIPGIRVTVPTTRVCQKVPRETSPTSEDRNVTADRPTSPVMLKN